MIGGCGLAGVSGPNMLLIGKDSMLGFSLGCLAGGPRRWNYLSQTPVRGSASTLTSPPPTFFFFFLTLVSFIAGRMPNETLNPGADVMVRGLEELEWLGKGA